jgi:ELWxxDGT repeat protein
MIALNDTLYFVAEDPVHGIELWKSDGTEAGTVLVKDISPGPRSSYPAFLTDVAGTLFFVAEDPVHGRELWKSDGTEAGTVLVKDIRPGAGSGLPVHPSHGNLTAVGKTLFFAADDGAHGLELWKSDGTAAGTVLVKDIRPGPEGSRLIFGMGPMVDVNGTLYFAADDGAHGRELWKSDGTEAGTVLVKDIKPGPEGSGPSSLANVNGTLFFAARDGAHLKLWTSDGTAAGTVPVKEFFRDRANARPEALQLIGRLIAVDGGAFLVADWHPSGERVGECRELWYLSAPRRPGG